MTLIDHSNGNAKKAPHILMALVENKPGVLTRVASLFRRRGFNIESLTVGHTDNPDISRMTIVVDASKTNATMVANNLFKLVNVIDVQDVSHEPAVTRDLALIKVKSTAQTLFELNQMVDIYRAKVVDICAESVIVEVTGPESKIDSMVGMLEPYGILEMVRTGLVAMVRGSGYFSGLPQVEENGDTVGLMPGTEGQTIEDARVG
ncbi:MAG: acetolactate synthase small subunit [Chloroflexi bacterium]|nr:acetolactate synthase small subunit [Chloroflexota bacterium]